MSNGRSERRIPKTVSVEVSLVDGPTLKEKALTENVSPHGVRVLMQQSLRPRQQAVPLADSPEGFAPTSRAAQKLAESGIESQRRAGSSRGLTRFPYPELEHSPTSYLTRHGYAHVGDGTLGSL